MTNMHINMEDIDALLDLDSPYGGYDDGEQYLDTATSSESTSPIMSTFDMSMMPDLHAGDDSMYPSPISSTRETASPQPSSAEQKAASKPAAKRKRENRYKNAPPSVLSRRRAQNRASQRAYRERKDQRIKDLETMLSEQKQKSDSLSQAYSSLHAEYLKLRGVQVRAQNTTPRYPSPMPYDTSTMAMAPGSNGGIDLVDNMFVFQDMQTYSL